MTLVQDLEKEQTQNTRHPAYDEALIFALEQIRAFADKLEGEEIRKEFEKWVKTRFIGAENTVMRNKNGYLLPRFRLAFEAWQAALAVVMEMVGK